MKANVHRMGHEGDLTSILRDVVQFLEYLQDVKLPVSLESIRDNLLMRSKETLSMFIVENIEKSCSSEAYLIMNAVGPKVSLPATKTVNDPQEYVDAEEHWPQKQQQDYYEICQSVDIPNDNPNPETDRPKVNDEVIENALMETVSSFSAAQTKSKCHKCGPLYRKEGKKLFVFEQYRACWVGLVGFHLLIYGSDRDNRPCTTLPIRGYMARAASNATPRDQRKSESTFEIFRPGSRTFQFAAKTPQDMEQWVAKICELAGEETSEAKNRSKILVSAPMESDTQQPDSQPEPSFFQETYQDVGSLVTDKKTPEDAIVANAATKDGEGTSPLKVAAPEIVGSSPPPLPARIPRRLPLLPVRGPESSYECPDEEEDDIYHRIEDLRDSAHCYGNVGKPMDSEQKPKKKKKNIESAAERTIDLQNEATYDDASTTIVTKDNIAATGEQKFVSYDNIENLLSNTRSIKLRELEKAEKTEVVEDSPKTPQKKSFLNRVRSKKESPRKSEKKAKRRTSTPPPVNVQELPTYDDVSELMNTQETKGSTEEEESKYTCPPPPRPIYGKPPPNVAEEIIQEEFYDDVGACREKYKDEETKKVDQAPANLQRTPEKLNYFPYAGCANNSVLFENVDYLQQSFKENEHYQTPRTDSSHHRKYQPPDQQEELYDDVAILTDFTARQKEVLGKKDEDATKAQISLEKRSKNRFVNGKKSKLIEPTGSEMNSRTSNEGVDDFDDQHNFIRMNTFQKLISKMENSLGKASVRIAPSMLLNKTNVTNNV